MHPNIHSNIKIREIAFSYPRKLEEQINDLIDKLDECGYIINDFGSYSKANEPDIINFCFQIKEEISESFIRELTKILSDHET